jgi:hypothetical protein
MQVFRLEAKPAHAALAQAGNASFHVPMLYESQQQQVI